MTGATTPVFTPPPPLFFPSTALVTLIGPPVDDALPAGLIGVKGLPRGVLGDGNGGEFVASGGEGGDGTGGGLPLKELLGGGAKGLDGGVGGAGAGGD